MCNASSQAIKNDATRDLFQSVDANGDGFVDRKELNAHMHTLMLDFASVHEASLGRFQNVKHASDAQVDAAVNSAFSKYDINHDGKLDLAEFREVAAHMLNGLYMKTDTHTQEEEAKGQ